MIVCGIDPGIAGNGIAIINEKLDVLHVDKIPTMARGSTYVIDPRSMVKIILKHKVDRVVLERVHGGIFGSRKGGQSMGGVSAFKFGEAFGAIWSALEVINIKTHLVQPAEWKAFAGVTKEEKKGEKVLPLVQELFPDAGIKLKKHHNMAEALLIARYGLPLEVRPF